jgi:flagellar biosynthesis protein FlhA
MSTLAQHPFVLKLANQKDLLFPIAFISLIAVILVPLPPFFLDLLLVVNITLSIIILSTTIYVKSPLEFAVLPSLLLAITLFRLVLNVATTRLILTAGDRATNPQDAIHAAGEVVQAFSSFVTGGSLIVGVIIFIIIFVIQFIVITKGATRISEVAARFTLDAMPGKQMAIDADMASGNISEPEARKRREAVAQEADFYGAMDGASKFVRGDAVAAIVITFINILGGFYVGMVDHGWQWQEVLKLYTKLTIGDGLVSQVPAFIVSLGAGLIVTRSSSRGELGAEVAQQIFAKPEALMIAAAFLVAMSVTGLPATPLLIMGAACTGLALLVKRSATAKVVAARQAETDKDTAAAKEPEKVEGLLKVDTMALELGYGLVKLVDPKRGGNLTEHISSLRRRLAMELGIIVPPVRIRDDINLGVNDYIIKIRGQTVARGVTYPEQFMAMDSGAATAPIEGGEQTVEPAFGLPAYWITDSQKGEAELMNYTVVEASAVLATHLTEVVRKHAYELLSRQEVKHLLDTLKEKSPAVVEEVVPTLVKPGEVQKVLQNLLRERVPVRDLETILETLGDFAGRTKDVEVWTEYVRNALARTICKQYLDADEKLWCVTLDPALEELINGHVQRTEAGGTTNTMPPRTQQQIVERIAAKVNEVAVLGKTAVVLCSPHIRAVVRRMIEGPLGSTAVLGLNEIVPEVNAEAVALVGVSG